MRGVFLHVLGDALGSVGVMISGVIIMFWDSPYAVVADPLVSLLIVAIILKGTIPLTKECMAVLIENQPAA